LRNEARASLPPIWYTDAVVLKKTIHYDLSMSKNVTIYSTPACHFCHAAKDFFKENNVVFTEHDVSTDAEKRKEMVELTSQMGVPVIRIGDDIVIGFDEPKLRELLDVS
jgi:glutaredoxin-like YruB-family protein